MKKKILVLGGGGYVGTKLVLKLLMDGFNVVVIDTFWFGNYLPKDKNLKVIVKDIRFLKNSDFKNFEIVVHLANIANDPGVELNQALAWEVNCLALHKILEFSSKNKIKQFIYASSGSVYGVKKEKQVTENLSLVPISTYNKTKMIAERVILSYQNLFATHIIRPATVCGLSPRMRYDVSVNLLTMQAINNKKITVFGGKQIRPNIHIDDLVDVYLFFINNPKIKNGFYNAGFENISINKIAKIISKKTGAKISYLKSTDPRSYRQSSEKLLKLGYKPKLNVENAIDDIISIAKNKKILTKSNNFTVKWMKRLKIK